MNDDTAPHRVLARPLPLPCGAVLKNRLAKAAMSDSLGDGAGGSTPAQARLYERWAEGGAALAVVGEVQGDPSAAEKPGNLVLTPESDLATLRALTRRATRERAHLWPQLGHAGALAHPPISRPRGPSALDVGGLRCDALSRREVEALPAQFARTARLAREAGFTGVQLHAAHGFLLSQFLSPLFNRRTDDYGGSIEARSRIVREVVDAVRTAVGPAFPVGLKINATDQLEGGLTEAEALEALALLDRSSLDLVDISGGTYFPGAKAASDADGDGGGGGPYFVDFARRARRVTAKPLMTTGGFKTREAAAEAVASGATDVVGLARAMVLDPALPKAWLGEDVADPAFPRFAVTPPGGVTAWYTLRLTALGEDREDRFDPDVPTALERYEARDAARCETWRARFGACEAG